MSLKSAVFVTLASWLAVGGCASTRSDVTAPAQAPIPAAAAGEVGPEASRLTIDHVTVDPARAVVRVAFDVAGPDGAAVPGVEAAHLGLGLGEGRRVRPGPVATSAAFGEPLNLALVLNRTRAFSAPAAQGEPLPDAQRDGSEGALRALGPRDATLLFAFDDDRGAELRGWSHDHVGAATALDADMPPAAPSAQLPDDELAPDGATQTPPAAPPLYNAVAAVLRGVFESLDDRPGALAVAVVSDGADRTLRRASLMEKRRDEIVRLVRRTGARLYLIGLPGVDPAPTDHMRSLAEATGGVYVAADAAASQSVADALAGVVARARSRYVVEVALPADLAASETLPVTLELRTPTRTLRARHPAPGDAVSSGDWP